MAMCTPPQPASHDDRAMSEFKEKVRRLYPPSADMPLSRVTTGTRVGTKRRSVMAQALSRCPLRPHYICTRTCVSLCPCASSPASLLVLWGSNLGKLPIVGPLGVPKPGEREVWVFTGLGGRGLIHHAVLGK